MVRSALRDAAVTWIPATLMVPVTAGEDAKTKLIKTNELIDEKDIMGSAITQAKQSIDNMYSGNPTLEQIEERYIKLILGQTNNQKDKAAKVLGINRRTLYRKERVYGIVSEDTPEPGEESDDVRQ